ncbi:MAG: choice-of-anchor J domain-containing protein [Bacteroidota bacterium]
MLRKLFTLLAVALTLPMWAQTGLVPRRVLIEEFTQASCPPCAAQNPTFNQTLADNAQHLTPIKYQTSWPGYDPMNLHNPDDVQARVDYYAVTGVPNGRQNGTREVFPMTSYNALTIDSAYNTLTPVTIVVNHTVTPDKDSVLISVAVSSSQALTGTLMLRVGVTEAELNFLTPPGTNGELDFYNVMKKMLPDANGTATGNFAAGETKNFTFAWPLQNYYNLNQVEAAVWLQDDATKQVWQSELSKPNTNFIDGLASLSGGVNQITCQNSLAPQVTILNGNTNPLTNVTFLYSVDGAASQIYNWVGNVAKDESAIVTFPVSNFTATGPHTFATKIVTTNNGEQLTQLNIISQVNNALYVNTPIPLTEGFQTTTFPPANWGIVNAISNGWTASAPGGFGTSSKSLKADFFNLPAQRIEMYLPQITLPSDATLTNNLKYDYAYTYYNATFVDSLNIAISSDCGATWTDLLNKWGTGLATAAAQTTAFTPTASKWKSNTIDLSAYAGQTVIIRFEGRSGYGNNLYLDNINVSSSPVATHEALDLNSFTIQPNPARDAAEVRFDLGKTQTIQMNVLNLQGVLVQSLNLGELVAGQHVAQIDANRLPAGSYRVVLNGAQGVAQTQLVVIK